MRVSDSATSTSPLTSSSSLRSSLTVLRGTITPGMRAGALGQRLLDAGQAVAVGGDGAQHLRAVALGGVQVDAVEVVAGFLGADGEAGAVDQAAQLLRRQARTGAAACPAVIDGKSSVGSTTRLVA